MNWIFNGLYTLWPHCHCVYFVIVKEISVKILLALVNMFPWILFMTENKHFLQSFSTQSYSPWVTLFALFLSARVVVFSLPNSYCPRSCKKRNYKLNEKTKHFILAKRSGPSTHLRLWDLEVLSSGWPTLKTCEKKKKITLRVKHASLLWRMVVSAGSESMQTAWGVEQGGFMGLDMYQLNET